MKILLLALASLLFISCASHNSTGSRYPASLSEIDQTMPAEGGVDYHNDIGERK